MKMPGSNLFFRILLWFLAALLLLFALGVATAYLTHEGFFRSSAQSDLEEAFSAVGGRAVELLTTAGYQEAKRYLDDEGRERKMGLMLVPLVKGIDGHRPTPPDFPLNRVRRLALGIPPGSTDFIFNRPFSLLIERLDIDGEAWALVGVRVMRPLFHTRDDNPWRGVLQLLVILIVGGAACWWLARSIARPIRKLQETVSGLAEGDLTRRTPGSIASRRDEMGDLARNVNVMAERLEEMVTAQRRLISDVSHELRSPLTRLGLALELAETKKTSLDRKTLMEKIGRETEHIRSMVNQLLRLSSMETEKQRAQLDNVDMSALLAEVADDVNIEAEHAECRLAVTKPETLVTVGRKDLLRSALENIIRNALHYTEKGTTVEATLRSQDGTILFSVKDRGPGVPERDLANLFEPFYRVDSARARETGGAGLGLAIAERAVRFHKGSISAANRKGGGLVVSFSLPLEN